MGSDRGHDDDKHSDSCTDALPSTTGILKRKSAKHRALQLKCNSASDHRTVIKNVKTSKKK